MNLPALTFLLLSTGCLNGQNPKAVKIGFRLPFQFEWQKAEIEYSWGNEIKKSTQINFGADIVLYKPVGNSQVYAGGGFFRNKINIQRLYDYRVLNFPLDSTLVGVATQGYTYHLFTIPMGFTWMLPGFSGDIFFGIENKFNISISRKYHAEPVVGFEKTNYPHINYFGNAITIYLRVSPLENYPSFIVEPFFRIFNRHRKDFILYEREYESLTRYFDAIGINILYVKP